MTNHAAADEEQAPCGIRFRLDHGVGVCTCVPNERADSGDARLGGIEPSESSPWSAYGEEGTQTLSGRDEWVALQLAGFLVAVGLFIVATLPKWTGVGTYAPG
jgi:hypothetical protein